MTLPQSFVSELAPRLRNNLNSLLIPVFPTAGAQGGAGVRTTKRGTTVVSYADDFNDNEFDDSDGPRRPTGLRSRRDVDAAQSREALTERLSKEVTEPVATQGIWREWMGKPKFGKTDKQLNVQAALPLTLVPIRVDLEIPSFTPPPALPLPTDAYSFGINPSLPAYRASDPTLPYRLRDVFLWNLHETLITPEQFAQTLVNELDLPTPATFASQIAVSVRQQLEEHAGVALHPLFQSASAPELPPPDALAHDASSSRGHWQPSSPKAVERPLSPQGVSTQDGTVKTDEGVTAEATLLPTNTANATNPDDAYRCIVNLSVNLLNRLFTDRFEWSLVHPPGTAEQFARLTCAEVGLAGEWVPAIAHAIYEAVLRLKREVCESGGLSFAVGAGLDTDSPAFEGSEGGWRYDPEHLADEWEPRIELLSKDEIEKREGDRERQIRRQRRENARFTTVANVPPAGGSYFDIPDVSETPMGRGERSKKKRRFRSLSPVGRGGTPQGVAEISAGGSTLGDW